MALEGIAEGALVNLSFEVWERSRDFDDKLLAAFDSALEKAGYKNESIRERELWKGKEALEKVADPSVELELRAFAEKVIPLFRYEIAKSEELSHYVQSLHAKANAERFEQIQAQLDRLAPPEYFHKLLPWLGGRVDQDRHPNLADFESGTYYRDDVLHRAVLDKLDAKRRALILGTPGSGKTALALGIGYEFARRGPVHTAYYIRANHGPDANTWVSAINRHSGPDTLFIVDDAHSALERVDDLVGSLYQISAVRVLVVSRSVGENLRDPEGSYIDLLRPHTIPISVDETTVREIVRRLVHRESIGDDEIGDTETILEKCEGDLHLLNYYVKAWEENKSRFSRISEVPENEVLSYVYRKYLREPTHREHLLKLAALSQFEIPVQASWLGEKDEAIREKALVDRFLADERFGWRSDRSIWFLEYFHSTPAVYLVKAAAYEGRLNGETAAGYTISMLEQYLAWKPINFLDVFYNLYQNDRADLQIKLYEQTDAFVWFADWLRETEDKQLTGASVLTGLWPFLLGVRNWNGKKARELFQEIKTAISEESWLEYIRQAPLYKLNIVLGLRRFDSGFVFRLLSSLNFRELGARVAEEKISFAVATLFTEEAGRVGFKPEHLREFSEGLCEAVEWRLPYLTYALNRSLHGERAIRKKLQSGEMNLKDWNIFIHNLGLADPDRIEDLISNTLRLYSAEQFGMLFAESDLRNISTFFNRFNPHDSLFEWPLPEGIDFSNPNCEVQRKRSLFVILSPGAGTKDLPRRRMPQRGRSFTALKDDKRIGHNLGFSKIDLERELAQCSLSNVAHFLFNFHFIGQQAWSYHFGKQLQDRADQLRPLIEEADFRTVGFFSGTGGWLSWKETLRNLLETAPSQRFSLARMRKKRRVEKDYSRQSAPCIFPVAPCLKLCCDE